MADIDSLLDNLSYNQPPLAELHLSDSSQPLESPDGTALDPSLDPNFQPLPLYDHASAGYVFSAVAPAAATPQKRRQDAQQFLVKYVKKVRRVENKERMKQFMLVSV